MNRYLRLAGSVLAIAALVVLAIVLVLTLRGERAKPQPLSPAQQSPIATPTPAPPAPIPTLGPMAIERCAFTASAAPPAAGPSLDSYHFSAPQVVLTHTSAIGIAGWLPDGQRLLIARLIPHQSREYIEVFNTRTGKLQQYGERHSFPGKPVWLAAHQAVAFADVSPDKQIVLHVSRGEAVSVETPVTGLSGSFLGVSPDGGQVVFFTQAVPNRPEALDVAQAQRVTFPVTLPLTPWPVPYRVRWHPQGHQIAFYNETGFYLADLPSGRTCEIDLGFEKSEARYGKRWAFYAQWSPDGRYLAMLTTIGNPPVKFSDLTVLDTITGELHSMHPEVYINPGQYYVQDMTWAPNGRVLAILATVEYRDGATWEGLYLVGTATAQNEPMLPHIVFPAGDAGWNLAWSPNGNLLAVTCLYGPLCLIEVTQP